VKLVILIFVFKIYVENEAISKILIIFAADIINDLIIWHIIAKTVSSGLTTTRSPIRC